MNKLIVLSLMIVLQVACKKFYYTTNEVPSQKNNFQSKQVSSIINDTIKPNFKGNPLKFSEAKNYFIKNNYPDKELHSLKIISETQFNTLFGAATTMGKSGMPTRIDFSKYYVVALIGKTNNKSAEIDVKSVIKLRNTITVTVFVTPKEEGKTQGYSSRPVKLLIIENKYQGKIKIDSY